MKLDLDFSNNNTILTTEGIRSISQIIERLRKLEILVLNFASRRNEFQDEALCDLAKSIGKLSNLSELDLDFSFNKSKKDSFKELGIALKDKNKLKILKISYNRGDNCIDDEIFESFLKDIVEISALTTISMQFCSFYNSISNKGFVALAQFLAKNLNLSVIDLDFSNDEGGENKINDWGVFELAKALPLLKHLHTFCFKFFNKRGGNAVSDCGIKKLVEGLDQVKTQLKKLVLNYKNYWEGKNNVTQAGKEMIEALLKGRENDVEISLNEEFEQWSVQHQKN